VRLCATDAPWAWTLAQSSITVGEIRRQRC
jgi:hypothetical protein